MTNERREKLLRVLLLMRAHEAVINEAFIAANAEVFEMERGMCDISKLSSAQDKYYALDEALVYLKDSAHHLSFVLDVDDVTAEDFDREFIQLSDNMPREGQEVFVLFENGKVCVSSCQYSKAKKRIVFAYENEYGNAVAWLPLTESEGE